MSLYWSVGKVMKTAHTMSCVPPSVPVSESKSGSTSELLRFFILHELQSRIVTKQKGRKIAE